MEFCFSSGGVRALIGAMQTPPFAGIRAAVFDFDGTLFDATDAICHSLNAALVAHERPPLTRAEILPRIGRPLYEIFQTLEPGAPPERVQSHVDAYREAFWPVCLKLTRELPGLRACVESLRGRVGLAIATNRSGRGAQYILDGFGFGKDFSVIVALEDVEKVKPDAEPVLKACAQLSVPPEQAVMVGDTPDDMRAGRAAGAMAVGMTTGAHSAVTLREAGAYAVLDSLAELPTLLNVVA
ncbi:MAG: HAD family hydrolase [Verrucomicrobia bacterium]|nr:MAG: HAD family hydrolase [Verrucomicrobiota bacterium]